MGSDLFSAHHRESWCLCQQFRNQQATWMWVITTSTKPSALLQHPSGQWRKPAAMQEGKLHHSAHLSITISSSYWPWCNLRAFLASAVQSRSQNFLQGKLSSRLELLKGKKKEKKKKGISPNRVSCLKYLREWKDIMSRTQKHWSDIWVQNRGRSRATNVWTGKGLCTSPEFSLCF